MLALAHSAGHVRLGLGLARRLVNQRTSDWPVQALDTVLYPVPPWRPDDGFKLDRALIFAFMRQESSFNPRAKSHDGARGLMQLLPSTASSIDRLHNFRGKQRALLYDPGLNMALGQRYLRQLLRSRRVKEDLLRLATGYNAGPGNLRKWERRINHEGDPLLFLEMLPTLETRLFVERVLTNLWVYRQRFGQDAPSLRALASDQWPPIPRWTCDGGGGSGQVSNPGGPQLMRGPPRAYSGQNISAVFDAMSSFIYLMVSNRLPIS